MKATTIKWIDRRVGVILCRLFSWAKFLSPKTKLKPVNKIVFIKLIEQGASVLAYSALLKAIEKIGKQNVYFLVFEENKAILDFLDVLEPDNIIVIRNNGFKTFALDLWKALFKMRREKIDAAIDMEFFSRASTLISYLSGAKKRVGLYSFTSEHPYRGSLVTHKIHYNPYIHVSKYYASLILALEDSPVNEPLLKVAQESIKVVNPRIQVSESAIESIKLKIGNENKGKKLIILNPNASDFLPLRKWETKNFENLAVRINQEIEDTVILFTGVAKEKKAIDEFASNLTKVNFINLAGATSLEELMALYQIADVLVTNDSGPAHFASMFSIDVVVLFGPETPELFAPIGDRIHVIYKKLACSPCVNVFNHRFSPCTNNVCMQNIEVEEVFQKVKSLM